MLAYGEDKAIQDAFEAGANGFIMVDLPPEEAITFREKCQKSEYVCVNHALKIFGSRSLSKPLLRPADCSLYDSSPYPLPRFHR